MLFPQWQPYLLWAQRWQNSPVGDYNRIPNSHYVHRWHSNKEKSVLKLFIPHQCDVLANYPHPIYVFAGAEPLLLHEGPPRDNPIYHVNHSPNGYFLAACCNRGILIWDAAALYLLQILLPHPGAAIQHCLSNFFHCSFSDDSKHFVAGASNGVLKTWRVESLPTKTDQKFPQSLKAPLLPLPVACLISTSISCVLLEVQFEFTAMKPFSSVPR